MEVFQDVLIGGFVVSVMLSVGLDLDLERVLFVFRRPRTLIVGLLLNHAVMPLAAVGVSMLIDLPPPVSAGLMLCAAAPGAPMAALLIHRAGGQLAFTVSLLVVMTLLNTVLTPVLLSVLLDTGEVGFGHMPAMARTIVLFLLVPLALGMTLRRFRPARAERWQTVVKWTTNIVFVAVFGGIMATRWDLALRIGPRALAAMATYMVLGMGLGYAFAGGDRSMRIALALLTGIRNIALSLLFAAMWFSDPGTLLTVMTYGLVMLVLAVPVSVVWARRPGVASLSP